ncbi:hypothetical protein KC341_g95 [Hortaea werneckii]|nr:hypothetical protein KC341_g95 [Hortaea werneckii]
MAFVMQERLRWQDPKPRGGPFEYLEDYKTLHNDWPHGVDPRIVHLVVWTKFDLPSDPVTDDLKPQTRHLINTFVEDLFVSKCGSENVIWFKNWGSLKSIHALYRRDHGWRRPSGGEDQGFRGDMSVLPTSLTSLQYSASRISVPAGEAYATHPPSLTSWPHKWLSYAAHKAGDANRVVIQYSEVDVVRQTPHVLAGNRFHSRLGNDTDLLRQIRLPGNSPPQSHLFLFFPESCQSCIRWSLSAALHTRAFHAKFLGGRLRFTAAADGSGCAVHLSGIRSGWKSHWDSIFVGSIPPLWSTYPGGPIHCGIPYYTRHRLRKEGMKDAASQI